LNKKNVAMSYIKYEIEIVTRHKVELVGWPSSIQFASPSVIGTIADLRMLRSALHAGECKWVTQSQGQQVAYAEKLAARVAGGESLVRKRKERSDKGKKKSGKKNGTRKQVADVNVADDSPNTEQPKKKRQRTSHKAQAVAERQVPPTQFKSREFLSTDDDESM
jgi:hypothetical protein